MADNFFLDSFDHYTTIAEMQLKWQSVGLNNVIIVGGGRNGKNAVQTSFPAPQNTLAVPLGVIVLGMAYQTSNGFNGSIQSATATGVGTASVVHVGDGRVQVNFVGQLSAASTFVMSATTWYFLETSFSLVGDGTHVTLTYIVKINNSVILSGSLQINNATLVPQFVTYSLPAPGGGGTGLTDDFHQTAGIFLGDDEIDCRFAYLHGDLNQFLPVALMPLRTPGSTLNAGDPLHTSLVGLWVMNEGSGSTDLNLVDSTTASFVTGGGPSFLTWFLSPASNVMERIQFGGGGASAAYLNAGHAAAMDHLPINKMTIAMGFRWNTNSNSQTGLARKLVVSGGNVLGFQIYITPSDGLVSFYIGRNLATPLFRATVPFGGLTSGQLVQLTITWDGTGAGVATDAHIYINGVEATYSITQDGAGTIGDETGNDLGIGIDFANNAFSGDMFYVALYKGRILTTTEMNTLNTTLPITQGDATSHNWRYVNEWSPDFDDSKVQTDTAGNKDLYFFDQIGGNPGIVGSQFLSLVDKSLAGAASVENIIKSGGVEIDGAEFFPSFPSYQYNREAYLISPFTGLPWTVAEQNALQFGIKRQS